MDNIIHIPNGSRYMENGWIRINVKGSPYDAGYAHGSLVATDLKEIMTALEFIVPDGFGFSLTELSNLMYDLLSPIVIENYPDIMKEIEGITKGAQDNGFTELTIIKVFFWNCWYSVGYLISDLPLLIENNIDLLKKHGYMFDTLKRSKNIKGGAKDKCTGFIALGDWTKDGKIVCGHNTFDNYIDSQFANILLLITPDKGNSFIMQTSPGQVCSGTDYYVSSNGFIVTETTIGGFNQFALKNPLFCRIRQAVQYSKTLEDYSTYLQDGNSGDYANSWLIGDTINNEIMRIELGLNQVNVERKKNGYFIGFNAPYDQKIRNLECVNSGFYDIRRHQGARRVRLEQLMIEHKGKLDIKIGQAILADHYDVYLNKVNPCSRTCCSHYDLDQREFMSQSDRPFPFQPRGALDGIVSDTTLAKNMGLSARWGSSCGMAFDAAKFCDRNIQWRAQKPYLKDRPSVPWTTFTGIQPESNNTTRTNKVGVAKGGKGTKAKRRTKRVLVRRS